ncbi:Cathepsin_B [Hexamita inflata]|uniref:Cathepsin B n=1 Tax=Hexamita inflata TaxID=28002 RepID=A0AA86QDH2_9EUKA|nr:Cathepsin B [Hexamita inflata]CAI9956004.1 Cathepsin B [Hexamita inflata]
MIVITYAINSAHQEVVNILENIPGITWKAKVHESMKDKSNVPLNQIYKSKVLPQAKQASKQFTPVASKEAPDQWDWIQMNPGCSDVVPEQGYCGASAHVSVMNAFSDFRCFQGKDADRVEYSPQYMLNCDPDERCTNCEGSPIPVLWAWKFLIDVGTVPSQCVSYKSGVTGKTGKCPTSCDDGSQIPALVKAKEVINICISNQANEEAIKQALINGPVSTMLWVYEDLYYYESGIYQHMYGKDMGWSSCEFVGYGEENGVKYWKVKNIWGRQWGENGYFRILRGSPYYGGESQIEYECVQAQV